MDLTTLTSRTVITNHEKLGLTVPAPITDALRAIDRIRAEVASLRTEPGTLERAFATAVAEDRDPYTDPAILRIVIGQMIVANDSTTLEATARERFVEAFRSNARQMLTQWQDIVTTNGEILAREHAILGNVDLQNDATEILNRGGDIAAHFLAAREADQRCEEARAQVQALANSLGHHIDKQRAWNLVLAEPTLDQWETHDLSTPRTPWQLTRLGLPLSLASITDYQERLAALQQTREQRFNASQSEAYGRILTR